MECAVFAAPSARNDGDAHSACRGAQGGPDAGTPETDGASSTSDPEEGRPRRSSRRGGQPRREVLDDRTWTRGPRRDGRRGRVVPLQGERVGSPTYVDMRP